MQAALPSAKSGVVYIYALQHPETLETRYIGRASAPRKRLWLHLQERGLQTPCAKWIRKLTREGLQPVMVIVETSTDELWPSRERAWIAEYRAGSKRLLNVAPGGDVPDPLTPEARARQVAAVRSATAKRFEGFCDPQGNAIGDIYNLEAFCRDRDLHGPAMRYVYQGKLATHKGWTNTRPEAQEALRRRSAAHMLYQHSEETRRKISESNMGKNGWAKGTKKSSETIAKMTAAQNTPEAKESKRKSARGRKHTAEAKAKMSAARRAR